MSTKIGLAKKQYLLVLLEDRTEEQVEDAIKTIWTIVPNVFSIQRHEPVFRSAQIKERNSNESKGME